MLNFVRTNQRCFFPVHFHSNKHETPIWGWISPDQFSQRSRRHGQGNHLWTKCRSNTRSATPAHFDGVKTLTWNLPMNFGWESPSILWMFNSYFGVTDFFFKISLYQSFQEVNGYPMLVSGNSKNSGQTISNTTLSNGMEWSSFFAPLAFMEHN